MVMMPKSTFPLTSSSCNAVSHSDGGQQHMPWGSAAERGALSSAPGCAAQHRNRIHLKRDMGAEHLPVDRWDLGARGRAEAEVVNRRGVLDDLRAFSRGKEASSVLGG